MRWAHLSEQFHNSESRPVGSYGKAQAALPCRVSRTTLPRLEPSLTSQPTESLVSGNAGIESLFVRINWTAARIVASQTFKPHPPPGGQLSLEPADAALCLPIHGDSPSVFKLECLGNSTLIGLVPGVGIPRISCRLTIASGRAAQ